MSEESSSTPLRLKPKLKADPEGTAGIRGGEPAATVGGEEESAGRLKLKPRSPAAPPPSAPVLPPASQEATISAEPKVRLKPRLTPKEEQEGTKEPPAAAPPPEPSALVGVPPSSSGVPPVIPDAPAPAVVGGFKLRPKTAADEPPPLPTPSPASVIAPPSAEVSADAVAASPPKMRVKPPPELVASFSGGTMPGLPQTPARGRRPVLTLLLVVVLLGGGGYYGYYGYTKFIASTPSESAPAEETPAGGPTSLPGRMVSKAEDAVAAQNHRIDDLDEVQRDPNGEVPPAANESAVMAAMPARIDPPAPPAPEPSDAFTRFVTDMRISGVFQGEPPRALINGRTIRAGETIDLGLGIVFVGIDADRRLILMREPSGALAAKKY